MLSCKLTGEGKYSVYLDGKLVGHIKCLHGCYQYFPKGHKDGGEVFTTMEACKRSLEQDDTTAHISPASLTPTAGQR
jgi:hypothetical protein